MELIVRTIFDRDKPVGAGSKLIMVLLLTATIAGGVL